MVPNNELMNEQRNESQSERELIFMRILNAPRELVYKVWTVPEHVAHWWGPNNFTNTIREMDVRPGGVWSLVMHAPDGSNYPNRIQYLEVLKNERLTYTHGSGDPDDPGQFHVKVTFESHGNKTKLSIRAIFTSADALDQVIKESGIIEGSRQTMNRLEAYLEKTTTEFVKYKLVITRILDAPQKLVFSAFADSSLVSQWWGPKGFTNPVCEIDASIGGTISILMKGPDGTIYPMSGFYKDISAPDKLTFTASGLDESGQAVLENLNTIILATQGHKTILTIQVQTMNYTRDGIQYLQGMEEGWNQSIQKLIDLIKILNK